MDNAMISRIEKAKRYAEQPERFQFQTFKVTIRGNNSTHWVTYDHGTLASDYDYFVKHGYSQHTMALERILQGMIVSPAQQESAYVMDSSRISKLEKAKQYAQERSRFHFDEFEVSVKGDNNSHLVTFNHGKFACTCEFFQSRGYCQHTMALERILVDMINTRAEETSANS